MRDPLALNGISRPRSSGLPGGGIAMQSPQFPLQHPATRTVGPAVWPQREPLLDADDARRQHRLRQSPRRPCGCPRQPPCDDCTRPGVPGTIDSGGLADFYESLGDNGRRKAFHHVLRAAVDWGTRSS